MNAQSAQTQRAKQVSADERIEGAQKFHADAAEQDASFIDTFAAFEDLIRFQSPRVKTMAQVAKAELLCTRKAVFVSIALTLIASLIAISLWALINAYLIVLTSNAGWSLLSSIGLIFLLNASFLIAILFQLKSAVNNVSFSRTVGMVLPKE